MESKGMLGSPDFPHSKLFCWPFDTPEQKNEKKFFHTNSLDRTLMKSSTVLPVSRARNFSFGKLVFINRGDETGGRAVSRTNKGQEQ